MWKEKEDGVGYYALEGSGKKKREKGDGGKKNKDDDMIQKGRRCMMM